MHQHCRVVFAAPTQTLLVRTLRGPAAWMRVRRTGALWAIHLPTRLRSAIELRFRTLRLFETELFQSTHEAGRYEAAWQDHAARNRGLRVSVLFRPTPNRGRNEPKK